MAEKLPRAGDAALEQALADLRTYLVHRPLRGFTEAVLRRIVGVAFACWVLKHDPQQQYFADIPVGDEQALGVTVRPNVTKGDAQRLLVALTEGMARTFPDKPFTIVAFSPSGDKLAEANYDPRSNRINVINVHSVQRRSRRQEVRE